MRDMVFSANTMGEGVNVASQLRVDGVAAVHGSAAHRQPRLNIFGFSHHDGQMLKDQPHSLLRESHVLFVHVHVAHSALYHMAEGIHTTGSGHHRRRVEGEFAIENHMSDVKAYQHGGAFHAVGVGHHSTHGNLGASTSSRGYRNHRQRFIRNHQKLEQQGFGFQMG